MKVSFVLSLLKINCCGVTFTHESTGLVQPCNFNGDLLLAGREMSVVVPAITLSNRIGILKGRLGTAKDIRITVTSK